VKDIEGSVGDFDHRPITGADGRVELELDSGVDFGLGAQGDFVAAGSASADVPALKPEEARSVTLELDSGLDAHLFGKVVADESSSPIEGARVLTSNGSTDGVRSGPDGRFDLELALWRRPYLEISAKGFGLALVVPGYGYGSVEDPIVVRLVRSCSLIARVLDRGGKPIGEASVKLATGGDELSGPEKKFRSEWVSLPDEDWSKQVDADGRCRIDDLPAGVPLRIEISVSGREVKRDSVPLSLSPGQIVEREWRIGAGCKLTGRVVDPEGAPVPGISLWMTKSEAGRSRRFDRYSIEAKERRSTSGADGTFEFGDVDPRTWLIGPAPENERKSIAPFPDVLEIPAESSEVVHDIRIIRGLYIRGHVVDSKDSPVPEPFIWGRMTDAGWLVDVRGEDDGSFELGPLVPGQYELSAMAPMHQDANSEVVTFTAGDADAVLKLRAGGTLSGRVIDSLTGSPCSAELVLVQRDGDSGYLSLPHSKEDGSYRCAGLPAGTYDVTARTPDCRVGRQLGIAVRPGEEFTDIVIEVVPGAKLRIRYEAASGFGQMHVRIGGSIIAADGIAAGSTVVVAVPAGRVVAELVTPPQSHEVDLAVGEEKTVVLTGPK
jgi:hypothetical protein